MSEPKESQSKELQSMISRLEERNDALEQRLASLEAGIANPPKNPIEDMRSRVIRERKEREDESRKKREPEASQRERNFINRDRAEAAKKEKNDIQQPQLPRREKKPPVLQFIPMEFYCWVDGAVGLVTIPIQFEPEKLEDLIE